MTLRTGDTLGTHAEYEQRHEGEREMELAYEADRRVAWARTHDGSLDGYVPSREFPCPGVLTVARVVGSIAEVGCSACGFEAATVAESRMEARQAVGAEW